MRETVRRRYEGLAETGELQAEERQLALADKLDALLLRLAERERNSKKSALGWLLARGAKPEPIRGLYIWGGVGRGKTFLMDMFFEAVPVAAKRRVHFHAFMGEVHERIDLFRRKLRGGEIRGDDPIEPVAAGIAAETRLLCFDEFTVNDIADAMILGRLFEKLFSRGVTVVTTSNVPPDDLYKDGLNRALFLPFVALLKERMEPFHLDGRRDYRLDAASPGPLYVTPLGPDADAYLDGHFRRLSGTSTGRRLEIPYKGRTIAVPEAAGGVARFSFQDLCARPLAAGDYLKLAATFSTIILAGVPVLGPSSRNEAKRFINLIDTLYDNHVRLIVSAEAEPQRLWQSREGVEGFEFARTASRLIEMRSDAYWESASRPAPETKAARAS
jgi:cell division protein ZapE